MARKKSQPWSPKAAEILRLAGLLALELRYTDDLQDQDSLREAKVRLQQFCDAWLKTGDGDVLPNTGKNSAAADQDGALCDVDVIGLVIEAIDMRLE